MRANPASASDVEPSVRLVRVADVNGAGRTPTKRFPGLVGGLLGARRGLPYLILAAAVVVLLAGGGFAALETDTVESYWEGVWWALSLMTTVGFASGSPASVLGKILASVVMVLGFLLLALTTAGLASLFVREEQEPEEVREHAFEQEALARLQELTARLELIEQRLPPRS